VVPAALREDIAPAMVAGPENNVAGRIQQALHVQDFRHAREWVVQVPECLRQRREDRSVRAAQRGVPGSRLSHGKKKAR